MKVKIYKIHIDKAFMAGCESCSLSPWRSDTAYYQGGDDGGREYNLPDGCRLGVTIEGHAAIYDAQDRHCDIIADAKGRPVLVSSFGITPPLELA